MHPCTRQPWEVHIYTDRSFIEHRCGQELCPHKILLGEIPHSLVVTVVQAQGSVFDL